MREEGESAGNPFVESFTYPGNRKRIFIALFGVAAGLTVIWYTAMFSALRFLKSAMRMDATTAEIIVGISAALGMVFFVIFGALSAPIRRKKPIVWGYAWALVFMVSLFVTIGSPRIQGLVESRRETPVYISG